MSYVILTLRIKCTRSLGLSRNPAHNNFNLKFKIPDVIPIVFHNLSSYDTHVFIKKLGKKNDSKDIEITTENKKKYLSFNVRINVQLAGVTNKGSGKEAFNYIQLRS